MSATVPAVELFTTSILSNHKVRHRHERYVAVFTAKKVKYVYHDLASDVDAKKRFRRKAQDPQIPNILVHNEWRGTFEEFEEAVEFGELDMFLRIDPNKQGGDEEMKGAVSPIRLAPPGPPPTSKLPPAPHAAPKMAPVGSGAGPRRNSIDEFLDSINDSQQEIDSMSEADLSSLLEEGESVKAKASHEAAVKAPQSTHRYPGEVPLRLPSGPVKRTYFPSEQAGIKPLRLPKMGNGATASRSASVPTSTISPTASPTRSPTTRSPGLPRIYSPTSSSFARYSTSQNSSRALAAEASASASSRVFSARQVRAGLDSGKKLQEVLGGYVAPSSSSSRSQGAPTEIDDLMEDLGLGDLNLTEEEAESFLLDGVVPEGMELGGSRLRNTASKAREQEAARDVASQARALSEQRRESAAVARRRQASQTVDLDELSSLGHAKEPSAPAPEVSEKTKALLERVREKRASRLQSGGSVSGVAGTTQSAAEMLAALKAQGEREESASKPSEEPVDPPPVASAADAESQAGDTTTVITPEDDDEAEGEGNGDGDASLATPLALNKSDPIAAESAATEEDVSTPQAAGEKGPIEAAVGDSAVKEGTATSQEPTEPDAMSAAASDEPIETNATSAATAPAPPQDASTPTTTTPKPKSPVSASTDSKLSKAPSTEEEEIDELLARLHGAGHLTGGEDESEVKAENTPTAAPVDIPVISSPPPEPASSPSLAPLSSPSSAAMDRGLSASASTSSTSSNASSAKAPRLSAPGNGSGTSSRPSHPPISASGTGRRTAMDIPRKISDHSLSSSFQSSGGQLSSSGSTSSTRRRSSSKSRNKTSSNSRSGTSTPPATPQSPRLKARLSSSMMRALSGGGDSRKSRDKEQREREQRDKEYSSMSNQRAQRTLSQILRDADAALAEAGLDDEDDATEEAKDKDKDKERNRISLVPDDGMEWGRDGEDNQGEGVKT